MQKMLDTYVHYNYNIIIRIGDDRSMIAFEWDENKNLANQQKHGVSFEEAKTVFYDEMAILFDDPEHSKEEDRFLIIGTTAKERICIVSHCYRGEDQIIRIISARKATQKERAAYQENL